MNTTALPHDSIDTFIIRQLPAWLTAASTEHLLRLQRCLVQQQRVRQRLHAVMAQVIPLDVFAAPRLAAAIASQADLNLDVRSAVLQRVTTVHIPSFTAGVPSGFVSETSRQSLLAAALHNFAIEETRHEAYAQGSMLLDASGAPLSLTPPAFAALCRTLDLGGHYRSHLQSVLSPSGEAGSALHALVEEGHRAAMEAAVRLAAIKGEIDERSYRQLLPVIASRPVVPSDTAQLHAHEIRLLGKQAIGVVAFGVRNAASSSLEGVIAWIPDDPHGALSRFDSWEQLYQHIAARLRLPGYAAFFQRFISERDRAAFTQGVAQQLAQAPAAVELDGRAFAVEGRLFEHLRRGQLDKILEDGRLLAVPTADEDRDERDRRLKGYLAAGLDLLGLAAFFVPGLGLPLLGIAASQVADEVYEGYHSWQLGDREAALGHLFAVAQTVVSTAVTGGAGVAAGKVLERVAYVDGLTPVSTPKGALRLSAARGAEQARHWSGSSALLRPLDSALAEVSDDLAEQLLAITGLDQDRLRRLHLEQAPAPARLLDVLQRHRLHEQAPALHGEAFETRLAQLQLPSSEAEAVLMRDFSGLSARCAREIVSQSNGQQLQTVIEQSRVPLALAERVRWARHDSRLDRALAGLHRGWAMNPDIERLALGVLEQWQPWPETVRVELRETTVDGALIAHTQASTASDIRQIVRGGEGYGVVDGVGVATPSEGLFEALLLCLDDAQKRRLGDSAQSPQALGEALARRASRQREQLPAMLGMTQPASGIRPPVRLGDGRVGYPLSGRPEGNRQAIRRWLHRLYPTYTDHQLDRYMDLQVRQGNDLWEHCRNVQQQLSSLQSTLDAWLREPVGLLRRLRRSTVARQIRRAWRRKLSDMQGNHALMIQGEDVGSLPRFASEVDFSHIIHLTLRGMRLESLEQDWLRMFSGVSRLDLRDNQFTALPVGLEQLARLTVLRLDGNRIVLDGEANTRLGALRQLRELDLGGNPVTLPPRVDSLVHLRRLSLRSTGLQALPAQVLEHPRLEIVDLRDNLIQTLPEHLPDVQRRRLRSLVLHDNPLDSASAERLRQFMAADNGSPARPAQHAEADDPARERWLSGFDQHEREARRRDWARLQAEEGGGDFFRFLADLSTTAEYRVQTEYLQLRVWEILETCLYNTETRDAVFQLAAEPRGCIDQLLLILSSIEVRVQVVQLTAGLYGLHAERPLLRLGRSLFRLDEVNRIAAQYINELERDGISQVDDVEVYLAYRIGLAGPLDLPRQPRYMYFEQYSLVSKALLRNAEEAILRGETRAALSRSLAARDFWVEFLHDTQPEAFDAMSTPFHEQLETLTEQAASMSEQAYLEQVDSIAQARAAAERILILKLSRHAYDRHPDL
ncbi:MAG TPA: NEL-type E3 ubiquitin ligase domain-containing protein [Pseudomonas sp.]|uniref:NEL-type E3 ubiquitin ligase domain-containing protein n=1 Tax=Pseudomonas sp. TaxID=306 RepID=UPI002B492DDE|nr:NEL-type E3 ubiquitin ligase domain-containing protein [Pseudomonas sp.]HKS12565.1 NEL-type E3 ubiquitin ligase domain-containing protein [Pseudomonas sp.]